MVTARNTGVTITTMAIDNIHRGVTTDLPATTTPAMGEVITAVTTVATIVAIDLDITTAITGTGVTR